MVKFGEQGQGLVEYALILVLVAIVVIAVLLLMGPQIANIFSRVTSGLALNGSGGGGGGPYANIFGAIATDGATAQSNFCNGRSGTTFRQYYDNSTPRNWQTGGASTTTPSGYTFSGTSTCP
jgi:pilus assembly protein Flp/PilA